MLTRGVESGRPARPVDNRGSGRAACPTCELSHGSEIGATRAPTGVVVALAGLGFWQYDGSLSHSYPRCTFGPVRARGSLQLARVPPSMPSLMRSLWADDSGQGLVEYALIIALVAVGLIAILLVLRNSIGNVFNNCCLACLKDVAGMSVFGASPVGQGRRSGLFKACPDQANGCKARMTRSRRVSAVFSDATSQYCAVPT
jgi:pilus assembly protein Flp/PilA